MELETNRCTICGSRIYPGHGSMHVKNNLNIFRFCRSKCFKLFKLKKNPFFLRWTIMGRKIKGLNLSNENKILWKSKFLLEKNENYNSFLTLQTFYGLMRVEKFNSNKKTDYKILKKIKKK